jgi:hypothetical protein
MSCPDGQGNHDARCSAVRRSFARSARRRPGGKPALAADPAAAASAAAGNTLESVAAVSRSDAWAVGSLIEHWNGRSWGVVRGALTPCAVYLNGVAARSASSAWAVGYCGRTRSHRPIIEHWNGHQWSVQPSPGAAASAVSQLNSVTVTSQSSAWAVKRGHIGQEPHRGLFRCGGGQNLGKCLGRS